MLWSKSYSLNTNPDNFDKLIRNDINLNFESKYIIILLIKSKTSNCNLKLIKWLFTLKTVLSNNEKLKQIPTKNLRGLKPDQSHKPVLLAIAALSYIGINT